MFLSYITNSLKQFKLMKLPKMRLLCFGQRFLSNSGIPLIIEYVWFFINHLVVRDAALAILRKDDHSACTFCNFAVCQHFCVTHLLAYCHQNAVRNRCAQNLLKLLSTTNLNVWHVDKWCVLSNKKPITQHAITGTCFLNTIRTGIF